MNHKMKIFGMVCACATFSLFASFSYSANAATNPRAAEPETVESLRDSAVLPWNNDPACNPAIGELIDKRVTDRYNAVNGEFENIAPPADITEINCIDDLLSQRMVPPDFAGRIPSISDLIDLLVDQACEQVDKVTTRVHDSLPRGEIDTGEFEIFNDLGLGDFGISYGGVRRGDANDPLISGGGTPFNGGSPVFDPSEIDLENLYENLFR